MIKVGRIIEIWRYPVSSIGGELCQQMQIVPSGIEGDRQYALFDPASGEVAAPEKEARWRPALFLSSRISNDRTEIGFPDGCTLEVTDPALLPRLQQHFGFTVAIGRYGKPQTADASLPAVSNRYQLAPLHLLTTASLSALGRLAADTAVDRRRFRPNLLIQTDIDPCFAETGWIGGTMRFGDVEAKVSEPTKRCGMTFLAQPQLEEQVEILRHIVRSNGRTLGVYCDVVTPGTITVGKTLYIRSGPSAAAATV